jgi:SAM-dependent methyltransferase
MTEMTECVACGSSSWDIREEWQGYRIACCHKCGLGFTLNPDYRPERYSGIYTGEGEYPLPQEHAYVYAAPGERLRLETLAFFVPPPRLTPAERLALSWLKRFAPPGAVVIDCGCGAGRFLRALKHSGFQAVGVEISPEVVDRLNQVGLMAVRGYAPDFEWRGETPFAITFFEVLEHLPQPVDMLIRLRKRFPGAVIIASVPSPRRSGLLFRGERGLSDYPPNHFLRWTPEALEHAFCRAGYTRVEVILPPPVGSEMFPGLGQLVYRLRQRLRRGYTAHLTKEAKACDGSLIGRFKATAALWALWLYQRAADVVGSPKAWVARRRGASAGSMLVIAEP